MRSFLVAAIAALLPVVASAARLVPSATLIEWHSTTGASTVVLSVQRPDGEVITETFAAGQNPMLRLEGFADGLYSYELRGAQTESGSFTLANGAVVSPDLAERPMARHLRIAAETYFADDVSARDGVCAGFDCTNAETYGLASAKLKENNTRLKFEDTSGTGFPGTDWQLSANDSTSGGANKFYVEDLTAATVPLVIEGGAPDNLLFLDSNGRVGIGTSTPGRELAINGAVSAAIRMEERQVPFATWDIVANDANFYVRNVTGEQNPFIIKSAAPYNTLVLDTTGRIGLGVVSPLYQIDHSSGARLDAGNWVNASSRTVKQDIHQLDGDAAVATLKALEPVTFAYKTNPAETHVGFIAEEVPELVATGDRKGLSSMDVVAVLTKVIQEQQKTIEDLQTRLEQLERND